MRGRLILSFDKNFAIRKCCLGIWREKERKDFGGGGGGREGMKFLKILQIFHLIL